MIKISGCCDGCGKEASRSNINEFSKVPVWNLGTFAEYDFCSGCIHELSEMSGNLADLIHELQVRHGRRG